MSDSTSQWYQRPWWPADRERSTAWRCGTVSIWWLTPRWFPSPAKSKDTAIDVLRDSREANVKVAARLDQPPLATGRDSRLVKCKNRSTTLQWTSQSATSGHSSIVYQPFLRITPFKTATQIRCGQSEFYFWLLIVYKGGTSVCGCQSDLLIFFLGVIGCTSVSPSDQRQRVFGFHPWNRRQRWHFGSPFGAIAQVGGTLSKRKQAWIQVKDLKERARLVVSVSATYGHTTARNVGFRRILPQRPAGTSNWSLVAHIFIGNGNLKRTPDTKV